MIKWLAPLLVCGCADLIGIHDPRDLEVVELTTSAGALAPSFDPAIESYRLELVHADSTVQLHAEANDPQATIDIAGAQSIEGSHLLAVPIGVIAVDVVAHTPAGVRRTYSVEIHRPEIATPEIAIAFAPPRSVQTSVPGMIDRVAIGDFDVDGRDDFAAITGAGDIAIFRNDGDTQFSPRGMHPFGPFIRDVASTDIDKDGKPDLIATASSTMRLSPGIGGGQFAAPFACGGGPEPGAFAMFQFDGDGRLDLAVSDQSGRLAVLTSHSTTPVTCYNANPAFDQYPATSQLAAVVAGAFDPNPGDDVATLDAAGRKITVHHNLGGSLMMAPLAISPTALPVELAAGDLDGDGRDELIWVDRAINDIVVQRGQGPPIGSFHVDGTPRSLTVADLDGDGHRDVIVLIDTGVAVLHNDGTGMLRQKPIAMSLGGVQRIAVADFNTDGRADLVTANFSSTVLVHLGVAP